MDKQFSQQTLRQVMGAFTTGVTVITSTYNHKPCGMTVNSFSSVSLQPPLILWCLGNNQPNHDHFIATEFFAVNILAQHQQAISDHFAQSGQQDFSCCDWVMSKRSLPLLSGCVATLECQQQQTIQAGDHHIMVGKVLAVRRTWQSPLVFINGQYGEFQQQQSSEHDGLL